MNTTANTVLVVAPVTNPGEIEEARAFAFDITDQLCVSTTVATSVDFDVTQYAAVFLYGEVEHDPTAALLWAEALGRVDIFEAQPSADDARCDACAQPQTVRTARNEYDEVYCVDCEHSAHCAWCGSDDGKPNPVRVGDGWMPLCKGCAPHLRTTSRRRARVLQAA